MVSNEMGKLATVTAERAFMTPTAQAPGALPQSIRPPRNHQNTCTVLLNAPSPVTVTTWFSTQASKLGASPAGH